MRHKNARTDQELEALGPQGFTITVVGQIALAWDEALANCIAHGLDIDCEQSGAASADRGASCSENNCGMPFFTTLISGELWVLDYMQIVGRAM